MTTERYYYRPYQSLRDILDSLETYETWLIVPTDTMPRPKDSDAIRRWYTKHGMGKLRILTVKDGILCIRVERPVAGATVALLQHRPHRYLPALRQALGEALGAWQRVARIYRPLPRLSALAAEGLPSR